MTRRFGASCVQGGTVFSLWAPAAKEVAVEIAGGERLPLAHGDEGWFAVHTACKPGTRYRFIVDGFSVPDPASRFQPEDIDGPSEVIDPDAFAWQTEGWRTPAWETTVLYELHVGTFSPEGTYAGVEAKLDHLASLGITAIELMPLADFPGQRNWGYDGVLPFAPDSAYGRPEDLKRLIDAAHARGLMVFLDVVYNHFGPSGNYLHRYAPSFFTDQHRTPWGDAINYDQPGREVVRDFFVANALQWLGEYRFDGLRFDAVDTIKDDSEEHFLEELARRIRAIHPEKHLVLENDRNSATLLRRHGDGLRGDDRPAAFTAQWNDDAHHVLHVLTSGEDDGYYRDYADAPSQRLVRALTEGFVYQGEASVHRGGKVRGEPSGHLPSTAFVAFLQNHDQIGNRAVGDRLGHLAPPEALKAATAVLLLAPWIPLLFMGEEWASRKPFLFFCDFEGDLAEAVRQGRKREFAAFTRFSDPDAVFPDPLSQETVEQARLDWDAREGGDHAAQLALVKDLLALRRRVLVPGLPATPAHAAPAGDGGAFVRWALKDGRRLSLAANLSATSVAVPDGFAPAGEVLFRIGTVDRATAAPWSVEWRIGT